MTELTKSEVPVPLSRRERGKAEKRRRILEASRILFTSRGFDQTTVQQIADLADVAVGTLFLYVSDKSELLLLLFHEDIGAELEGAKVLLESDESLMSSVGSFFARFLSLYDRDLQLSRVYIREFLFHKGRVRTDLDAQTSTMLELLRHRLAMSKARGEISKTIDLGIAALHMYSLYHSALSYQLAQCSPSEEKVLGALLDSFWNGLRSTPRPKYSRAAKKSSSRSRNVK